MNALLSQADAIALLHHRAKIPAITAEYMLLDLGFDSVKFDKGGVSAARFLGVWYPLGGADAAR